MLDRRPPRAWVQEVSRRSLSGSTSCENRRHEFCLRVTVPRHMAPANEQRHGQNRRHEQHKRAHHRAARHCGLPGSVLRSFTVERGPILLRVVVVVLGERKELRPNMSEKSRLSSILRVPARNVPDAINRGCAPRYSRNSPLWLGRVDALSRLPAREHATERPPPGLLQLARFAVGSRPAAWSPGSSRQLRTEAASGINVA